MSDQYTKRPVAPERTPGDFIDIGLAIMTVGAALVCLGAALTEEARVFWVPCAVGGGVMQIGVVAWGCEGRRPRRDRWSPE